MTTPVKPVIFERDPGPDRRAEHLHTADLECRLCHRRDCDALFNPVAGSLSAEETKRLDDLVRSFVQAKGRSCSTVAYWPEGGASVSIASSPSPRRFGPMPNPRFGTKFLHVSQCK